MGLSTVTQCTACDSPFGDPQDRLHPVQPPPSIDIAGGQGGVDPLLSDMDSSSDEDEEDKELGEKERCPNPCLRMHQWDKLYQPSYANKGYCLAGRRCWICGVKFMNGKRLTGEAAEGMYWASFRKPAHHCKVCNICACNNCRREIDLSSPRRNKDKDKDDDNKE